MNLEIRRGSLSTQNNAHTHTQIRRIAELKKVSEFRRRAARTWRVLVFKLQRYFVKRFTKWFTQAITSRITRAPAARFSASYPALKNLKKGPRNRSEQPAGRLEEQTGNLGLRRSCDLYMENLHWRYSRERGEDPYGIDIGAVAESRRDLECIRCSLWLQRILTKLLLARLLAMDVPQRRTHCF